MQSPPATTGPGRWLDRFLGAYFKTRPVSATFVGVHEFDHLLPDFSERGTAEAVSQMEQLLGDAPDESQCDPVERLDVRLARGFLRIQLWEYGSSHFRLGNPATYTGEAAFGLVSLFLSDYAPLDTRLEAAVSRMEAVPAFLETARENLRAVPRAWVDRALRECTGCLAFLTDGVERLAATPGLKPEGLKASAARAERAVRAFRAHLETGIPASERYACGSEALALYVEEGHFLAGGTSEIARYAEAQMEEAQAFLQEHARDFGARSPEEALAGLGALREDPQRYYEGYRSVWEEARALVERHDLLTWPEFPIRYTPVPPWARACAPYLYFLPYRAPAAFGAPPVHDYLVEPLEPGMSPAEVERVLQSQNQSVIKLNHVVHHGGVGHHVQNARAASSPSRLGRIAGIDCASRIALFCGGTMAEGWACYATDLMAEYGFLTPLEQYAERRTRARMCARAVVDVGLHEGRLGLEEATAYYARHAGMPEAAARGEAVKNSMFPGAALMYVAGTDAIHSLRRELRLPLKAFHDDLLSLGSVPVALVADHMRRIHAQ
jgi:hypothetical protein